MSLDGKWITEYTVAKWYRFNDCLFLWLRIETAIVDIFQLALQTRKAIDFNRNR